MSENHLAYPEWMYDGEIRKDKIPPKPFRSWLSFDTYNNKYANGLTWRQKSLLLVDEICKDDLSDQDKDRLFDAILKMKFIPGGRYMYYSGRILNAYNNCFDKETELLTDKGMKKMGSFKDGEKIKIYSPICKKYLFATMHTHGEQDLYTYTMQEIENKKNIIKILATKNHRWITQRGKVTDLKINDIIPTTSVFNNFKVIDEEFSKREIVYCPYEPQYEKIVINYNIITFNCFCFKGEEDTREEWARLVHDSMSCLMMGGGIGIDYSVFRPKGEILKRTGGISSGPISLIQIMNEVGRFVMQGGSRRSALYASLDWNHKDIFDFIKIKDWSEEIKIEKAKDYNYAAPLDMTNLSININDKFYDAYFNTKHDLHHHAIKVLHETCETTLNCGEPNFSFNCNGKEKETLRNACAEFISYDDSDVCNLGSINMSRIEDIDDFKKIVELGAKFLYIGGIRADLPTEKIKTIRQKNMSIGLGLMGIHEWLLIRNYKYQMNDELRSWLEIYKEYSEIGPQELAFQFRTNIPKRYRAIAPTGCQKADTMIVTNDGILELSELGNLSGKQWQNLPNGLTVAQENGKYENTTRFYINGIADTKKIIFTSGNELECTLNHQYRVKRNNKYIWIRADELIIGDKLIVALNTYHKKDNPKLLPIQKWYRTEKTINFQEKMNPKLAMFLGIFFGDGSIHEKGIRIACNAREDKYLKVAKLGKNLFNIEPKFYDNKRGCLSVEFSSKQLLRWLYLNDLDKQLSKNCEIPAIIRCSSRSSLKAFIKGYLFADGSYRNGNTTYKYIDTASKKLSKQMFSILRALGTDVALYKHMSGRNSQMYRLNFVKTKRKCEKTADTKWLKSLSLENCTLDEIKTIENSRCETFDIEVPETTTYIANGVVSHNTIGLIAGSSTGIEPLYAVAFKRRYLIDKTNWKEQYSIDSTAEILIKKGIKPEVIESAIDLANDPERRIKFQAKVQEYVDMGISSTLNLPSKENQKFTINDFKELILKYGKNLRGLTVYPDAARAGQPLESVPYSEAKLKQGIVYDSNDNACKNGVCGI